MKNILLIIFFLKNIHFNCSPFWRVLTTDLLFEEYSLLILILKSILYIIFYLEEYSWSLDIYKYIISVTTHLVRLKWFKWVVLSKSRGWCAYIWMVRFKFEVANTHFVKNCFIVIEISFLDAFIYRIAMTRLNIYRSKSMHYTLPLHYIYVSLKYMDVYWKQNIKIKYLLVPMAVTANQIPPSLNHMAQGNMVVNGQVFSWYTGHLVKLYDHLYPLYDRLFFSTEHHFHKLLNTKEHQNNWIFAYMVIKINFQQFVDSVLYFVSFFLKNKTEEITEFPSYYKFSNIEWFT